MIEDYLKRKLTNGERALAVYLENADGINLGQITIESTPYASIIDEATAGTTYIGLAAIGTSQASALWQIKKMVEASSVITITWADGNDDFDNVWSNRASLSYS